MAPKYTQRKVTGKIGALFVDGVVTAHGSIFRMVHEEDDVGIDGFIELVNDESVSGRIVAVQIKGGDSYVASSGDAFLISVDESHLKYWENHMVPVIVVGYSPSRGIAAWTPVREYIEHESYHDRTPITNIRIPFYQTFDEKAIATGIAGLAAAHFDNRLLIRAIDKCLSDVPGERLQAIQLIYPPGSPTLVHIPLWRSQRGTTQYRNVRQRTPARPNRPRLRGYNKRTRRPIGRRIHLQRVLQTSR